MKNQIKKIIILFSILYVAHFAIISIFFWVMNVKFGLMPNVIVPQILSMLLAYIPTAIFLRPLVQKTDYTENTKLVFVWALLPLMIGAGTAISQNYFQDLSYRIIDVNSPDEVANYFPREKFFNIKSFHIRRNDFSTYTEQYQNSIGKDSRKKTSLNVDHFNISPLYSDSITQKYKVAYGLKLSAKKDFERLNLSLTDRTPVLEKELNEKLKKDFSNTNLYKVSFFSVNDESGFLKAWHENPALKINKYPIILSPHDISFSNFIHQERDAAIFFAILLLSLTIIILIIVDYSHKQRIKNSAVEENL